MKFWMPHLKHRSDLDFPLGKPCTTRPVHHSKHCTCPRPQYCPVRKDCDFLWSHRFMCCGKPRLGLYGKCKANIASSALLSFARVLTFSGFSYKPLKHHLQGQLCKSAPFHCRLRARGIREAVFGEACAGTVLLGVGQGRGLANASV